MGQNFLYDTKFTDNTLVLGQTGCGNTSFVQSLGKNKIFVRNLLSFDWVSKTNLTKNQEDEIRQCFTYRNVDFHYPNDVKKLIYLLRYFKKKFMTRTKRQTVAVKQAVTVATYFKKIKNLTSLFLWMTSQV